LEADSLLAPQRNQTFGRFVPTFDDRIDQARSSDLVSVASQWYTHF